jgi:hypothetical protein
MLLRSKAPPPFHSFKKPADVLCEGPAGNTLKKIFDGSVEERKDGIATLALLVQDGLVEASEAVDILGRALCDKDTQVRNLSFLNLARMGTEGIEGLFCGLSSTDAAIRKMSLDMIASVLSKDKNALRCANFEIDGVRVKVSQILKLLGQELKVKATECMRQIAARSPLVVLEETSERKKELGRDTEEYYRLNLIESSASDALRDSSKDRC